MQIPSRRWNSTTVWRRSGTENINLDTESTCSRRRSGRFSWWIERVSTNNVFSRLISRCQWSTRWFLVHLRRRHFPPSRWTKSRNLPAEGRTISYSRYIDVSRVSNTNLDVLQESRIDFFFWTSMDQQICPIHGQVSNNFPGWRKSLQKDTCGPVGD